MEAFSASSLDLNGAAGFGGGDGARETALETRTDEQHDEATDRARAAGVRQVLGIIRRNLFWAAVATLVSILVGGLAYLQTWPPLAIVQSGSMVPTIQIGDAVVLKHLDAPPRVGEIVVVHVPDAARSRYGYPPVVTHRIVRIADGMITTKGDALKVVDPFQTPVNTVTEQVVAVIPDAGQIYGFFTSTWGMLWLAVGALMLLGMPLLDRRHAREEEERGTMVSLQSQLELLTSELSGRGASTGSVVLPGSDGSGAAPAAAVESELRELVEQAANTQESLASTQESLASTQETLASTQETLSSTTAALAQQQERIAAEQERIAGELRAASVRTAAPVVAPFSLALPSAGSPAPPPTAVSWSWALVAAAATVVGCRLRGSRRHGSPAATSWAWPSSRPKPAATPSLKPLTEVLSEEAINRLGSSETVARIASSETVARIAASEAIARLGSSEAVASLCSAEAIARLGARYRRPDAGSLTD